MASMDADMVEALDAILRARFPKVRSRIFLNGVRSLPPRVKEQLREAVVQELLSRGGFDTDSKPTPKGLRLEDWIDLIGLPEEEPDS